MAPFRHLEEWFSHSPSDAQYLNQWRAADPLMRYHFYPPTVMRAVSDFGIENRWVRVGDRIVQRIHLFPIGGGSVIDVVTMNEITAVVALPRSAGFTANELHSTTTTACHAEMREWRVQVEWRPIQVHLDCLSC